MRKIPLVALVLASVALGYFSPHTPVTLTVVRLRDRFVDSKPLEPIAAAAEIKVAHAAASESALVSDTNQRAPASYSERDSLGVAEKELSAIQLETCQSDRDNALMTCAKLFERMIWSEETHGEAYEAAMSMLSKCKNQEATNACNYAASSFERLGDDVNALEMFQMSCMVGNPESCSHALWYMGVLKLPDAQTFAFAQASCGVNIALSYCRIVNRSYTPAAFEELSNADGYYGSRLLPLPDR